MATPKRITAKHKSALRRAAVHARKSRAILTALFHECGDNPYAFYWSSVMDRSAIARASDGAKDVETWIERALSHAIKNEVR